MSYGNNTDPEPTPIDEGGNLHIYAWIAAGAFTTWATMLSFHLMYKHSRNYTKPELQIYSIDSFLSLLFRQYSLIFDILRDCYEAYVIYMFFTLLVNFLEGKGETRERTQDLVVLLENKPPMKHPFPLCCLKKITLGRGFLVWCKFCVLQFAIMKPLTTVTALILESFDVYHEGNFSPSTSYLTSILLILTTGTGYFWMTVIDNISITIAMYFLVLFYMATKEELAGLRPVPKFLSIKMIIFFSFCAAHYADNLNEQVGAWSVENITKGLQDFLICVEMFVVSVAHVKIFGYEEFRNPNKEAFLRLIFSGRIKESTAPLLGNFRDAINPRYDIEDTKETLEPILEPIGKTLIYENPILEKVDRIGRRTFSGGRSPSSSPHSPKSGSHNMDTTTPDASSPTLISFDEESRTNRDNNL